MSKLRWAASVRTYFCHRCGRVCVTGKCVCVCVTYTKWRVFTSMFWPAAAKPGGFKWRVLGGVLLKRSVVWRVPSAKHTLWHTYTHTHNRRELHMDRIGKGQGAKTVQNMVYSGICVTWATACTKPNLNFTFKTGIFVHLILDEVKFLPAGDNRQITLDTQTFYTRVLHMIWDRHTNTHTHTNTKLPCGLGVWGRYAGTVFLKSWSR